MAISRLAKLSPPRASNWVRRARLHRLLDAATRRAVAWIAAEPGAGKSTLAAAWAAERTGRALWFRADATDADPGSAFGYFAELARSGRRPPAVPAYRVRDVERLDVFARTFFRSFFTVIPAASTLVIDDAHAAAGTDFDALLAAAIAEAPTDVAVVVASRAEPAGPLLDALAQGALEVVPGAALVFTDAEMRDLLGREVDQALLRRLKIETGGWAAGLRMLAPGGSAAIGMWRAVTHRGRKARRCEARLCAVGSVRASVAGSILALSDRLLCSTSASATVKRPR